MNLLFCYKKSLNGLFRSLKRSDEQILVMSPHDGDDPPSVLRFLIEGRGQIFGIALPDDFVFVFHILIFLSLCFSSPAVSYVPSRWDRNIPSPAPSVCIWPGVETCT